MINETNKSNKNSEKPIGIMDSGVGGLTVAKEIKQLLPFESTIYVGDTARVPYGTKNADTLFKYAKEIICFLVDKNVKAVVLACGTISSTIFERLQDEFPDLILVDVIRPGVSTCVELIRQKPDLRLGLIATTATIKSGMFTKLLENQLTKQLGRQLITRACPLFASMIEAGLKNNHSLLTFIAKTYLSDLNNKIDALVLGCTHYPLMVDTLSYVLGNINYISLATSTAHATKEAIISCTNSGSTPPSHSYYVSGNPSKFAKMAQLILNEEIETLTSKVCLKNYLQN